MNTKEIRNLVASVLVHTGLLRFKLKEGDRRMLMPDGIPEVADVNERLFGFDASPRFSAMWRAPLRWPPQRRTSVRTCAFCQYLAPHRPATLNAPKEGSLARSLAFDSSSEQAAA